MNARGGSPCQICPIEKLRGVPLSDRQASRYTLYRNRGGYCQTDRQSSRYTLYEITGGGAVRQTVRHLAIPYIRTRGVVLSDRQTDITNPNLPYPTLSCPILLYGTSSYPIVPYLTLYPILICPTPAYPILLYTLSNPIVP